MLKEIFNYIEKNDINMLNFLYQRGLCLEKVMFDYACEYSNVNTIKWLLDKKCIGDEFTFERLLKKNNTQKIKTLIEENHPRFKDSNTISIAIKNNNLKVVQLLINECTIDNYCLNLSYKYGEFYNDFDIFNFLKLKKIEN
tara:strand:- start:271 stop:693 length:423 start_codon:yes stop_codon:yes gene_type:complete